MGERRGGSRGSGASPPDLCSVTLAAGGRDVRRHLTVLWSGREKYKKKVHDEPLRRAACCVCLGERARARVTQSDARACRMFRNAGNEAWSGESQGKILCNFVGLGVTPPPPRDI